MVRYEYMKWIKRNAVELLLGISGTLFLMNMFTEQDEGIYILIIPFLVLGLVLLYKRHCLPAKSQRCSYCEGSIFTLDDDGEDELYEDAKVAVIEAGKASTSYLQRRLRVGYSRAARLMDMLEENNVIGPQDGSAPREILKEE